MCGFAGFIDHQGGVGDEERELLDRMTRVIAHRGPDDEGFHLDSHAALGFRRLAIIDRAGGHQPLCNEDGTVWIVFNGEIYNHLELRDWLIGKGHRFRTRSDTETIVHLYEEVGTACAEKLRGMFAFVIWDSRRRELYLARDRVGKKPLYYAYSEHRFWFASEVKSILQDRRVSTAVDPQAIDSYLTFSYVPAPMTGFHQIRKLPGGHWMRVTENNVEQREYWDWHFSRVEGTTTGTTRRLERDYAERLRTLLEEAVRIRLVSEVPLGAFLSGGIDSSVVVALMAHMIQEPVRTTSIGFDHQQYNELPYAQEVAERYRTDHVAYTVRADAIEVLEKIVWHLDEPFGDSSVIPTYFLSQMTRRRVTVALSGDGGDEVFAGYDFRYLPTQKEIYLRRLFPAWLRRPLFGALARVYPHGNGLPRPLRLRTILRNLSVSQEAAHAYDISVVASDLRRRLYAPDFKAMLGDFLPEELVLAHFRKTDATHWLDRALYVDARFYMQNDVLAKVDKMSMANSLEVRCPLLDHRVMEFMGTVPAALKLNGDRCKHLLKETMRDSLQASALSRSKQGFSIPLHNWLRGGMREYAADRLLATDAFINSYFRSDIVRWLWDAHHRGQNYGTELWTLLMLELWGSQYVNMAREGIGTSGAVLTMSARS